MDPGMKPLNIEECVELICSELDDVYKDAFRKRLCKIVSSCDSSSRRLYQYEGNFIGIGFLAGVKACNDDTINQLKNANTKYKYGLVDK